MVLRISRRCLELADDRWPQGHSITNKSNCSGKQHLSQYLLLPVSSNSCFFIICMRARNQWVLTFTLYLATDIGGTHGHAFKWLWVFVLNPQSLIHNLCCARQSRLIFSQLASQEIRLVQRFCCFVVQFETVSEILKLYSPLQLLMHTSELKYRTTAMIRTFFMLNLLSEAVEKKNALF